MRPILAGIETEYGFTIEDRSVSDQVEDSMELVKAFPGKCFKGWDYRFESPRADLQGFQVDSLAYDPVDALFDSGRARPPIAEERADRVLCNGARFYNDHGHPEYATPECFGGFELARADREGEDLVLLAANNLSRKIGKKVNVYKNNTDYHGSTYGTHESYLVPREFGFGKIYPAVMPMLVARQILTGAGKVGAEAGGPVRYQLSARADHLSEAFNLETLFRRPVFNTRDEAHANPEKWIRLHVICGDANLMMFCTWRKVMLIKIAIALMEIEHAPIWRISDPARSFRLVSRDVFGEGRIELEGSSWTTPRQIIESYLDLAQKHLSHDTEIMECVFDCKRLLEARNTNFDVFRRSVDWAAKYWLLDQFRDSEKLSWHDNQMQSLDLAYHHLDSDQGLFSALKEAGEVVDDRPVKPVVCSRAQVRGFLVDRFAEYIESISWSRITLRVGTDVHSIDFPPDLEYPEEIFDVETIEEAIQSLREFKNDNG